MKEHYGEDVQLKSVMGSSAGGILGLGIACKLETSEMEKQCTRYLRNIAEFDKTLNKERNKKKEAEFFAIISNFLLDYGIIDEPLLYKLSEIIFSQEFQKVFI